MANLNAKIRVYLAENGKVYKEERDNFSWKMMVVAIDLLVGMLVV